MTVQDAYKWLYQATLGGEHAISDDSGPRAWMDREWASLSGVYWGEKTVQKLTPDGRLLRINLRPYKRKGRDKEMLLAIFVASAQRFRSDKSAFVSEWKSLGEALRKKPRKGLSFTSWKRLDSEAARLGYPAYHHSRLYEAKYKPAYRVVLGELWAGL